MSMIRDLRAVVRPARPSLLKGGVRKGGVRVDTGAYDATRDPATPSAVVDCAVYRDGSRVQFAHPLTPQEAMRQVRRDGGFVWIGLHEPTEAEFAGIAGEFGLHPLAVEDAVQAHQRPKLERYDDSLFTVFKTIHYVEHDRLTANSEVVETGEVMCFTGKDFFITVRHGGQGSLRALRHRLQDDPELLEKGPSAVLHAIADHVVDDYVTVADAVQGDIEQAETDVFSPLSPRTADAGRIYQLKRELLEFKRAVVPLTRPLDRLATEPRSCVDPEIQTYFRNVAGHLLRVTEQIAAYDALLDSILQAHLAQVTVAQNEDMRKITAWAAIIAVPTMVCGVYGMNFAHMPELRWRFGYPLALAVMAAACVVIHRGFKRNGWL
jgi:magnesium transporter